MSTLEIHTERLGTVTQMIWQMAMKKLKIKRRIIRKGTKWDAYDFDYLSHNHIIPTDNSGYLNLAKIYNRLIDEHEKLESNSGLLLTHAFDPSCTEDPVHRLTQSVSNWILDEIYAVGRILKESRHRLKLMPCSMHP